MFSAQEILNFWFDDPQTPGILKNRKVWFSKSPDFDREIQQRFQAVYEQAATGLLEEWQTSAQGYLALILLLDQFPRNLFRDHPKAFATDQQALKIAQRAIAQGFDQQLPLIQRQFIYMPFMHSEDLQIQHQSVELFQQFQSDPAIANCYDYAIKHLQVIERFGRFPHRNTILGRNSTPEEVEFLKQPGSRF